MVLISPPTVIGVEMKQFISNNGLKGKKLTVKQLHSILKLPICGMAKI